MTISRVCNTSDFVTLRDSDTVGDALRILVQLGRCVSSLPVVDESGKLVGVLSVDQLISLLLPKAALLNEALPDLSFVSDTLEHLKEKMRGLEGEPVSRHMGEPGHPVYPDTPLMEVLLLLYRGENDLPVIERNTGRLLGIVSAIDILRALKPREGR